MKKLIAGNWKMNTNLEEGHALISDIVSVLSTSKEIEETCDVLVCPPALYISPLSHLSGATGLSFGAQDCSMEEKGAHTGDISAAMIKDMGCSHVILGHSERRSNHGETNDTIQKKAAVAHTHNLITIICVGESEKQREFGQEQRVVETQLSDSIPASATAQNTVIAYEPVWAIGTGKTASPEDVAEMHAFIRSTLQSKMKEADKVRILYGGSMNPTNAEALLATPNVDGGLIGGASLKADQFITIAKSAVIG